MPLSYEKVSRNGRDGMQVTGYDGEIRDLVIPAACGGLPVVSIAGHAFAGRKDLHTAVLPESLRAIRSFAFYNCTSLESIELFNTTDDYYDGVIRQCPSLHRITVHCIRPCDYVIIREMLRDVDVTLQFRILTQEGELRLTFPEYVSEAREDTMARAIHFSIEGAGMAYRECVGKKALDLSGYDRLLPRLTDYDFEVAAEIALGRLSCPLGLDKTAEEGYEAFLADHDSRALEMLIRDDASRNRVPDVKMMAERKLIGRDALLEAAGEASSLERMEILAVLMEYRGRVYPEKHADTFTLDW